MSPAAAAAIVCSKQTKDEQIGAINSINGPKETTGRGKRTTQKRG